MSQKSSSSRKLWEAMSTVIPRSATSPAMSFFQKLPHHRVQPVENFIQQEIIGAGGQAAIRAAWRCMPLLISLSLSFLLMGNMAHSRSKVLSSQPGRNPAGGFSDPPGWTGAGNRDNLK